MVCYSPSAECRNPDTYGEICVQCGQCGRKFTDGILLHAEQYSAKVGLVQAVDAVQEKVTDWGTCPNCGNSLKNWGAASHGDGDIFDEIGCDICEEVIEERHASYCECVDCAPHLGAA